MAGYPVIAADINSKAGGLVTSLWDDLEAIRRFKLWLDDAAHGTSYTAGLGISGADDTLIRNGVADLGGTSGLWAVAHGTFAPAGASNYFFNAKNLTGVNFAG